jgi:hypothetical protein
MLIPAIARGEPLIVEDSLGTTWLSNVSKLFPIFREWWDYPELPPQPASVKFSDVARLESIALCFSGGVDSFHTLLRSGYRINYLVFALGFDIPLNDRVRFDAFEPSLREVASAIGATPVVIRTNLREHASFTPVSWERTHGGGLAAIGHLLSDNVGRLLISSSFPYSDPKPWGSSWLTDHFWSSERLQVIHFGAELLRQQKLQAIASEPLVRRHLRVCWENNAPTGNCSRCDKCVRTRLTLADIGELANYPGFEGEESLAQHIDALPPIERLRKVHHELANSERLATETRLALQRLIARSAQGEQSGRSGTAGNFIRRLWSWIRDQK